MSLFITENIDQFALGPPVLPNAARLAAEASGSIVDRALSSGDISTSLLHRE